MINSLAARQFEAVVADADVFMVQGRLEELDDGIRATIGDTSKVAIDRAGSRAMMADESGWRNAAGGALIIYDLLDCSIAPVRFRDAGAQNYPDTWTLGSGISGGLGDIVRPDLLAIREGVEEIIAATPDGVVLPVFGDIDYDTVAFGAVGSWMLKVRNAELPSRFRNSYFVAAPAAFMEVPGEQTITVGFEGLDIERATIGIISLDPASRGYDLIKVIRVKVNATLAEFAIFDGEGSRDRSFDAPIGCFKVDGDRLIPEFVATFQHGMRIETMTFNGQVTPPLARVLEVLACGE